MSNEQLSPIVLVHGAWHGGWCWERVAPRLRAAGHTVYTPTLTGLAERASLLNRETGLETHIADIAAVLEEHDLQRVILGGHSYGGMVITGAAAATPRRIARLIYLDAFVPQAGDSVMSLLPPQRAAHLGETAAALGEGWRIPPPPAAGLGVTTPADTAWLTALLTDQPLLAFTQPLALAPVDDAAYQRTYIHCSEGPIVPSFAPFAARFSADPTWTCHTLPTGHDAMVTMPGELAGLLLAD